MLFSFLQECVAACTAIWIWTLPLLIFRRTRKWMASFYLWSSYLTGLTCWVFSAIITVRTLGVFWLAVGILAGGVGVLPLAFVGEAVHGLWRDMWDLIVATLMFVIPRVTALWILYRDEQYQESKRAQSATA